MKNKTDAFGNRKVLVPFFMPDLTREDKSVMMNALSSPLLTDGPQLRKFEDKFAKFVGSKYAVGVSNCTAALHLALKSLGLKKGDEVIVPDITFVATANAVIMAGGTPVFVDVSKNDMNISIESIKKSITSKTKVILPVHLAGKICKMNEIKKIARTNNLHLIEDCAHAIGTKFNKKHAGTFGDAGCFSFYPTKNFTTIEGGMVITNSKEIAEYVKAARSHGFTRSLVDRFSKGKPWDYDMREPGFNYRLDEIRSTLGLNQLKRIRTLNNKRLHAAKYYTTKMKDIEGITTPEILKNFEHNYHLYIIRIGKDFGMTRDQVFEKIKSEGIQVSLHYKPLHLFSAYKKFAKVHVPLKNSEQIFKENLSLPFFPSMTKTQIDLVVQFFKNAYNGA